MNLTTDQKIMLGVGAASVVAIGGIVIWSKSSSAAPAVATNLTPHQVAVSAPSAWREITGLVVTIPDGATVAFSYDNAPADVIAEMSKISTLPATQATNVVIYPVGTNPPPGFPDDGGGLTKFRGMFTMVVGGPSSVTNVGALRTWLHT